MAPVVPAGVPASFTAGDSLTFTLSDSDFPPADGWTLVFALLGASTLTTETSEVTDDNVATFTVTIPAARTASLTPGLYRWFATYTLAGVQHTRPAAPAQGRVEVTPDPRVAAPGDLQYQEEKDLAVVRAAISGRLTDDMASYMIRGRQVVLLGLDELLREQARLERRIWRLKHAGQGFPTIRGVFRGIT